jgi:nuclear pore complex protein Nup107
MASLENIETGDSSLPLKSLQSAVIANTIQQYVADNGFMLGRAANHKVASSLILSSGARQPNLEKARYVGLNDQNGLRILAHVYLIVSELEALEGEKAMDHGFLQDQENVLAAYISTLRLNGLVELLPLYCSKLKGERAFFTLSRNIRGVEDVEERKNVLRIMEKEGMDIGRFVAWQPGSFLAEPAESTSGLPKPKRLEIFSPGPPLLKYGRPLRPDFLGDESEPLDSVDAQLVASFEWMMLVDGLWDEIFDAGVKIYERFLCELRQTRRFRSPG